MKLLFYTILCVQCLFSNYAQPNMDDWSSRFKEQNDQKIPGKNVVWVEFNDKSADIFRLIACFPS